MNFEIQIQRSYWSKIKKRPSKREKERVEDKKDPTLEKKVKTRH